MKYLLKGAARAVRVKKLCIRKPQAINRTFLQHNPNGSFPLDHKLVKSKNHTFPTFLHSIQNTVLQKVFQLLPDEVNTYTVGFFFKHPETLTLNYKSINRHKWYGTLWVMNKFGKNLRMTKIPSQRLSEQQEMYTNILFQSRRCCEQTTSLSMENCKNAKVVDQILLFEETGVGERN